LLCLTGPVYVTRDDFFTTFAAKLRAHKEVTDLNCVPEAYVPAIKLEFMGIEMDLLYAQLTQTSVSEDVELMNVELLRNLDDRSVRSVNGCRVTDSLLGLVPNKDTFRLVVRCLKLWAKRECTCSMLHINNTHRAPTSNSRLLQRARRDNTHSIRTN